MSRACLAADIDRSTYYNWRDAYPDFAAEADAAIERGTDKLEDIAMERASRPLDGSDTLLIFLLKARRPGRYRETTRHELTGPDGKELTVVFSQREDGPQ